MKAIEGNSAYTISEQQSLREDSWGKYLKYGKN